MTTPTLRPAVDEAVEAARARYVDRRPVSERLHAEASVALPGGNTRTVLFFGPYPFRVAKAWGLRAAGRRRSRLRRPAGRVHGGPVRPLAAGHPCRHRADARRRHQLRRPQHVRGSAGRRDLRPLPVARPGALHELGHRGEPDGRGAGPRGHGPRGDRRVRRRLPRRPAVVRARRLAAQRAVPHGGRPLQRRRGGPRPVRRARRRPGRRARGADAGFGRLPPRRPGVPAGAARRHAERRARCSCSTR